jgi:transposase
LQDLRRAHPGTLSKFFHEQNCRGEERIHERIAAIYQAVPATQDEAALEAGAMTARGLVAVLATLRDDIAKLDQRIAQLVADHPEAPLFDSLPGAGKALVPRLIVAFGTRRERYESAYQMQCYSGIAPVRVASGKTQTIHFRRACPKFLRQTFHEYALALAPEIGVGQGVLPDPARSPQVTPCGGQSLGLQMDSHHFPVLEGRQTL